MDNYNQNQSFSNYTVLDSQQIPAGSVSKKFMASVFLWMFLALGVSTVLAVLFAVNADLASYLYVVTERGRSLSGLGLLVAFAPLAFVLIMSFGMARLSSQALTILFVLFAAVMGMSLSSLIITYTSGSLIGCFAAASAMFGIMAVMGYTTDKDLTSFGSMLTMGLIGIVVASMINIFLHSEMINYIVSIIGVAVFTGLTAYDVQKLKRIGAGVEFQGMVAAGDVRKLALMGALNLYLDFINLFIMLLRLFGNRRDS